MDIRQGAPLEASDGTFGAVVDAVLDPIDQSVTFVVAEGEGDHHQQRRIPMWLLEQSGRGLRADVTRAHLRSFQRVLETDYVRSRTIPSSTDHRIEMQSVLRLPYYLDEGVDGFVASGADGAVAKSDCEIRRKSSVVSCNDRLLGEVEGFLVRDGNIAAVIVRSGLAGFSHDVAVPIALVNRVFGDMISLACDRDRFRALPTTNAARVGGDPLTSGETLRRRSANMALWGQDYVASKVARLRNRFIRTR